MLVTFIHGNPLIADPVIERELDEIMEFDRAIRVDEYGTVTIASDDVQHLTPTLHEGELDSDTWTLITHGYSGQDRYSGPIMHNSEFIGGGLARDIIGTPGVYVALVCTWDPEDETYILPIDENDGRMYGPYMDAETAAEALANDPQLSAETHRVDTRESDDNAEGWAVARWNGSVA